MLSLLGTCAWGEGDKTEEDVEEGTSGLGKGKIGKKQIAKERTGRYSNRA